MSVENLQSFKEREKEADLQQGLGDSRLKECFKRCAEMIFESGFTLKEAEKCNEECKSSHFKKLMFNDLNEKLEIIAKNLHDAQSVLHEILEYGTHQDSLF